jgi:aspartate/methionine/tyrosine aminotransferase
MLEIPLSGIKKIEEIAKSSSEYISLSQGAIRVGGVPQEIKNYLKELLNTDKTDYYGSCWGLMDLRQTLAQTISQQYNITMDLAHIVPTHGCIGGLSLLFLTLLEHGDEVIIPEPAYPAYEGLAQLARAKAVHISMLKDDISNGQMWELNVEKIKSATTSKTKMIVFSNPWNPLGIIVPEETILELIRWCEEKGIYLVIDEAYKDFVFEGSLPKIAPLVLQSPWVISANSFSKNMAMSGWRIGYLLVPKHIIKALAGMQDALLNCLNNTAQHAAIYALKHPEVVQHFHEIVKTNRDRTLQKFAPLVSQGIFSMEKPAGGFFAFLKTTQPEATDLVMSILHNAKTSMVPGIAFGSTGAPFMRLCFARDTLVLEEGLDRILNFFG